MKNFKSEIIFGSILALGFSGLLTWLFISPSLKVLPILIALIILGIGIAKFMFLVRSRKEQIETGMPVEDEYVKLAKIYAGNQSFHFSFYLWSIIFVFNETFSKNETMLGVAILGSALIYGVSLWYYRSTGEFNE